MYSAIGEGRPSDAGGPRFDPPCPLFHQILAMHSRWRGGSAIDPIRGRDTHRIVCYRFRSRAKKRRHPMRFRVGFFAWFYTSSVVSPARRDIFVTPQASDSYYFGPSSSSSSSSSSSNSSSSSSSSWLRSKLRRVGFNNNFNNLHFKTSIETTQTT